MGRCYYWDHRYGGGPSLDNWYSEGVLVMTPRLSVYKSRSRWVVALHRSVKTLRMKKFKTKGEAMSVCRAWRKDLEDQGRRYLVEINTATDRPQVRFGVDFDGKYVENAHDTWRSAANIQMRFYNKYGDQTLFLSTMDWSFVDSYIVEMRLKNDWWCEITQHGQSRFVFKPEKMAGENDRQSAA